MKLEDILRSVELKEEQINYLKFDVENFEEIYNEVKAEVSQFEYATDEYYSNFPLFHEINKFKKGKILKNVSTENLKANTFIFGFDEQRKLLLSEKINDNNLKFGINATVYQYQNDHSIKFFTSRIYPNKEHKSETISRGILTAITNSKQVEIIVSSNSLNWSFCSYFYENEKVIRVEKIASGWNSQIQYDCFYEDTILKEIRIGEISWWKLKK